MRTLCVLAAVAVAALTAVTAAPAQDLPKVTVAMSGRTAWPS